MSQGKDQPPPASRQYADASSVTAAQFWFLFSAVMLPMFMAAADQTLIATATPVIAAEFGQLHDTAWLATAYLLTHAVTIPIYGRLGDRYGRREILFVSMSIFVLGGTVCLFAPSMGWLIAGRALQGLGGGGLMTLSQSMIAELVPAAQRVRFQGYFAIVFTSANIIGPVIGGVTVEHVSWRWLFAMQIPLALFAAWRLSRLPRGQANPKAPGVSDRIGLALFVVATAMLLFGLSSAGHRFHWLSWWSLALFGGAAVLWALLIWHERRVPGAFFPLDLLEIRTIRLGALTIVGNAACRIAIIFYLPLYLQFGLRMEAGASGLLLLPIMFGILAGQQAGTQLGARWQLLHIMPCIGMAIAAIGLLGLAFAPDGEWMIALFSLILGIGLGPAMPCVQVVIQEESGRERLGAVTALAMLSRSIGSGLGVAATGAVLYSLLPDVSIQELISGSGGFERADVLQAFHAQFLFLAAIAGLATLVSSRIPRIRI
jgi:MFS family permease